MEAVINFLKEFWWLVLIVLIGVFCLVDYLCGEVELFSGVVVDRHYKPEHTYTTIGSEIDSDGQMRTTARTTTDPESYRLMVRTESGAVRTISTSATMYYRKAIGDKTHGKHDRGLFTNYIWNTSVYW